MYCSANNAPNSLKVTVDKEKNYDILISVLVFISTPVSLVINVKLPTLQYKIQIGN
jgi:hypothetical protein